MAWDWGSSSGFLPLAAGLPRGIFYEAAEGGGITGIMPSELNGSDKQPLFPNARGGRLSADGVQYIVAKYAALARESCPSLRQKRVTPHVLRHTTAMEMLQAGVDRAVIALWLGHESVETTQIYLDANLALKEEVLDKTGPPEGKPRRYKADDQLLAFLKGL